MSSDNAAPILSREQRAETLELAVYLTTETRVSMNHKFTEEELQLSQSLISAEAELSALRAELEDAKDTLKEHEEEHWCFNAEHGQVIIERDRLRAELEAVKAERDRQYEFNAGQIAKCAALEAEHEKARVRLEEAEQDTNRLDWLENKWVSDESSPLTEYEGQWHADGMPNGPMTDDMRSAIDAAISQTAQPEPSRDLVAAYHELFGCDAESATTQTAQPEEKRA